MTIWTFVRFLHVAAAILWVGGQLTLSLVIRPIARRMIDDEPRARIMAAVGSRYAKIASFALIPILLATGFALTYHHGWICCIGRTPCGLAIVVLIGDHSAESSQSSRR